VAVYAEHTAARHCSLPRSSAQITLSASCFFLCHSGWREHCWRDEQTRAALPLSHYSNIPLKQPADAAAPALACRHLWCYAPFTLQFPQICCCYFTRPSLRAPWRTQRLVSAGLRWRACATAAGDAARRLSRLRSAFIPHKAFGRKARGAVYGLRTRHIRNTSCRTCAEQNSGETSATTPFARASALYSCPAARAAQQPRTLLRRQRGFVATGYVVSPERWREWRWTHAAAAWRRT